MSATAEEIVTAAIQLSEEDRLVIVSRLLETIGEQVDLPDIDSDEFVEELRRRREDSAGAIPWSQLHDED